MYLCIGMVLHFIKNTFSYLQANYVSDLFQKPNTKPYLARTVQDMNASPAQAITITTN